MVRQNENLLNYFIVGVILFVIFIMGGGVYDIINNPPALIEGIAVIQHFIPHW